VHRIAAGGVDQDAFAGEEPVAVAGATDAPQDVVGAACKGKCRPDWTMAVLLPAAGLPMTMYQGSS
jgi:hypothetical protein